MKQIIFFALMLLLLPAIRVSAHPGSGIVVDKDGQIYFTDTGKGVWRIDKQGKLIYLPASRFHWMAIYKVGKFSSSPKSLGEYFEKVSSKNAGAALLMCSDFPLTINTDGNIYYAMTRPGSGKIIRRTSEGKETVLITDRIIESVTDMCSGADGALYITEAGNPGANTIRKITMDGKIAIIATIPSYCRGLAVDAKGDIYVASTGNRKLIKISPQGQVTEILKEEEPWSPTGVAIFNGEIYLLEWHDVPPELDEVREAWIPRVRKVDKSGKVTTVATVSRK